MNRSAGSSDPRQSAVPSAGPWLVAGLGNPGKKYTDTRHNIGHMVVNELANRLGESWSIHKAQAAVAEGRIALGGPKIILAKPATYMNLSGGPVSALMKFYKLSIDQLIVVHDELDIDFDTIRIKRGGGEGGHNGLKSITKSLGTKDYIRVRAGIGRPPSPHMDVATYVLQNFSATERKDLPFHLDRAADAVETIIADGMTAAQNRFHQK